MNLMKKLLFESTRGNPKDVFLKYMTDKGYKSVTLDGGSYGYTTTLSELSKPSIKWKVTDGDIFTTKTIKEIGKWLSQKDDWESYWDQDSVNRYDLEDLINTNICVFFKNNNGSNIDQEDWELSKIHGDR